jgi:hypothetical protein
VTQAPASAPLIAFKQGAETNGLADMIAGLIRQNVMDKPQKRRDFDKLWGRIAIVAEDALVALTLEFNGGTLTVHNGIAGIPDVTVRANSEDVVQMSLVELNKWGLPDPKGSAVREVAQKSHGGQIQVHGALWHVPMLLRFTRLMSVNG